uniref:Uncharacterized protein n=1 Tax=Rhizophagus irregularis (strain DAOM 181602 / DAOM 197198 / MUCL 43194) TaxID=747089 RepID=U9THB9_RHIID
MSRSGENDLLFNAPETAKDSLKRIHKGVCSYYYCKHYLKISEICVINGATRVTWAGTDAW